MKTFFLDEHKETGSWARVWEPICRVIRRCLEDLHGLAFDPASEFRIYCHRDKSHRPDGSVFLMQMHLGHLYSLDAQGWGVTHSRRGSPAFRMVSEEYAIRYCGKLRDQWLATGKSKCGQPKPSAIPLEAYILVPLQMPGDSVVQQYSPVSVEEFALRIGEWARQTQTRCILKAHPGCKREKHGATWAAIDRATEGNEWATLRQDNIHSLIASAAGVFTINSGTGFEAIIHGKPVVTFGAADYDHVTGQGTLDALDAAREYVRHPADLVAGWRFATHYLLQHCFWLGVDRLAEARICGYLADRMAPLKADQPTAAVPPQTKLPTLLCP